MKSIEFVFENPWLLLLAIPALLLLAFACRWMRCAEHVPFAEKGALILRTAEVLLVVLILSGFSIITYSSEHQTVILADRSDSMAACQEEVDACLDEIAGQADASVLGVIDFSGEAAPIRPLISGQGELLSGGATDLASALEAAEKAFTEKAGRRIVLLTDGVSTDGDLKTITGRLRDQGVRVDALPFDTSVQSPEMELTGFVLPADAAKDQRFSATLTALSNADMETTLQIYDNDMLVFEEDWALVPGKNTQTCMLSAAQTGQHLYRAELVGAQDTVKENNFSIGCMNVNDGAKILLVDGTGEEAAKLSELLAESGYHVERTRPADLPDSVSDLCAYGLVILMNVSVRDLPENAADHLETYVTQYGRSVLTTGGENTYFYGGMADTPFETFLPITMHVEEKTSVDPVALMLVIDVTDSMTRFSLGTPIEMARRSAIKCVDALNTNDYAGVITFSDTADVLVEMTSMREKEAVIAAINGIETVGPERITMFTDALRTACDELKAFDKLDRKHVIFITDGSPADKNTGFENIVKEMKQNNITLSTIAVGKIINVVKLLEDLSALGGGRCYFVESAYDLPDIMTMDTALLQVDYTIHDAFKPEVADPSFPFGENSVPAQLFGSIRAAAKPEADVVLASPDSQPVYVRWNVGEGRAASFMSDLNGTWSNNWFNNQQSRQMIADLIKELIPSTVSQSDMDVALEAGGARGMLSLKTELQDGETLTAEICPPEGESFVCGMQPIGPNLYGREIPLSGPGLYAVSLKKTDASGNLLDSRETSVTNGWSKEAERLARPDGMEALMELCSQTGGAMSAAAADLLAVDMGQTAVHHDAALPLSIAAMLCLLADIVFRKTQLKQTKRRRTKDAKS